MGLVLIACGPIPKSPTSPPASESAPPSEPAQDDRYYREGVLDVRLEPGIAIIQDNRISLETEGELARILGRTAYLSWRLSLGEGATGRDVIAAMRAGVEADFQHVQLGLSTSRTPSVWVGYSKAGWRKMQVFNDGIRIAITKQEVWVSREGKANVNVRPSDVLKKLGKTVDGMCDEGIGRCGNMLITVEDDVPGTLIEEVTSAVDGVPVLKMMTAKADLAQTMESSVERAARSKIPSKGTGRLPPETIQKIVREMYEGFRACYEQGLARDPALQGAVVARFVIDRKGSVGQVEMVPRSLRGASPRPRDLGTTMPDQKVLACIAKHYKRLKFPQPEGGVVTVVYPIMFSPG